MPRGGRCARRLLGDEPAVALAGRREAMEHSAAERARFDALLHEWEGWLAAEPMLLSLFVSCRRLHEGGPCGRDCSCARLMLPRL